MLQAPRNDSLSSASFDRDAVPAGWRRTWSGYEYGNLPILFWLLQTMPEASNRQAGRLPAPRRLIPSESAHGRAPVLSASALLWQCGSAVGCSALGWNLWQFLTIHCGLDTSAGVAQ